MSAIARIAALNVSCILQTVTKSPDIVNKAGYAAAAGLKGKMMKAPQRKLMEVETDTNKLANYVCGANYFKEGSDPPILPDSEYPEWLFTLRTVREPPDLSELSKDDEYYWIRLRKMNIKNNNTSRKYNKLKKSIRIW